MLGETVIGRWARRALRENGVEVLLVAHADDRLYPARKILVLDAGGSDAELAARMAAAAAHIHEQLKRTHSTPAAELMGTERDRYVAARLAEEALAQAARAEAMRQLRAADHDTDPPDAVELAYMAAHRRAVAAGGPGAESSAQGWSAGIAAVRTLLDRVGPRLAGGTYADFYGWVWDDARGHDRAPVTVARGRDGVPPSAPEFTLPLAANVIEGRLAAVVDERDAARAQRSRIRSELSGSGVTDDRLARLGPTSVELEQLHRSKHSWTRSTAEMVDEHHRWGARARQLDAVIGAYEEASRQRAARDLIAYEHGFDPQQLQPDSPSLEKLIWERDAATLELAKFLDIAPGQVTADQMYNLLGRAQQQQRMPLPPDDPGRFLFADRVVAMCERFLAVEPVVRAVEVLAYREAAARRLDELAHPVGLDTATAIRDIIGRLPGLDPDSRVAVDAVLGEVLTRTGAQLWPVETLPSGYRVQVRDHDGSRLLDMEIADGEVTVHTHLHRARPERVLLAQTLVPQLMTGWDERRVTRAFVAVVERFGGSGRNAAIGAGGVVTLQLSGERGGRQLDIAARVDGGDNIALYFDEDDDDRSGRRKDDVSGLLPGTSGSWQPVRMGDRDTTTAVPTAHSARGSGATLLPRAETGRPSVPYAGSAPPHTARGTGPSLDVAPAPPRSAADVSTRDPLFPLDVGDGVGEHVPITAGDTADGPRNCAPGVVRFVAEFVRRVAGRELGTLADDALARAQGVTKPDFADALGAVWTRDAAVFGSLDEAVDHVRRTRGAVAGVMRLGEQGDHAFGVAIDEQDRLVVFEMVDGAETTWVGEAETQVWLQDRAPLAVTEVLAFPFDRDGGSVRPGQGAGAGLAAAQPDTEGYITGLPWGKRRLSSFRDAAVSGSTPIPDIPIADTDHAPPGRDADDFDADMAEYWAQTDAAIDELIAINPQAYWYLKDFPRRPESGEPFGADWVSARGSGPTLCSSGMSRSCAK